MRIGVPKEIKPQENRIGLTPESVKILSSNGHKVLVETMEVLKPDFTIINI
jgi:L-alanine dehydrogenase (EC 1.4.1.1)